MSRFNSKQLNVWERLTLIRFTACEINIGTPSLLANPKIQNRKREDKEKISLASTDLSLWKKYLNFRGMIEEETLRLFMQRLCNPTGTSRKYWLMTRYFYMSKVSNRKRNTIYKLDTQQEAMWSLTHLTRVILSEQKVANTPAVTCWKFHTLPSLLFWFACKCYFFR